MGGDLPKAVLRTEDMQLEGNHYNWYSLDDVPTDGNVMRICSDEEMWLFTKTGPDTWGVTVVPEMEWPTIRSGYSLGAVIEGIRIARS